MQKEVEKTIKEGVDTEEFELLVVKELGKKIEEKLIPLRSEYEKRKKDEIMKMKRGLEEEAKILRQNQNAAERVDDIIQQNFAKVRQRGWASCALVISSYFALWSLPDSSVPMSSPSPERLIRVTLEAK